MLYGTTQALNKVEAIPRRVPAKPRDPERETIKVIKTIHEREAKPTQAYRIYRDHYVDTLPKQLQYNIAILKLAPIDTYIEGIGARTERGFILLVK